MKTKEKTTKKELIITALFISLMQSIMVGLFAPFELYLSQKEDYAFAGWELLPYCIALTAVCLVLGMCYRTIVILINKTLGKIVLAISKGLTLAIYVQGTYIKNNFGILDGSEIDWSLYGSDGIKSIVIIAIAVILSLLYFLLNKDVKNKLIRIACVCIMLMWTVTVSILLINNDGLGKEPTYVASTDNENRLSTDRNFIILILDTFDSDAFTKAMDRNPELYEGWMEDFTYYPDTLGAYPRTNLAVPFIISGVQYKNEETYGDYLNKAFEASDMLAAAEDNNWHIEMYSNAKMPQKPEIAERIDNLYKVKKVPKSHKQLLIDIYKVVGFRYLPYHLKRYCWINPDDIDSLMADEGKSTTFSWWNDDFSPTIDSLYAEDTEDCLKIYHLEGTHPDFHDTIEDDAESCIGLIYLFTNALKQQGLYDNSTIVIMADHGYHNLSQNPLLLIKDINEKHPYNVSDACISYFDLQSSFSEIINNPGYSINDELQKIGSKPRTRYFYYNENDIVIKTYGYASDIVEYTTDSTANQYEEMNKTGVVFLPQK